MEEEQDLLATFYRGETLPDQLPSSYDGWTDALASNHAAGKRMQRVHVVRQPLTHYLRFEIGWGYPKLVAAGEDIRVLPEADMPNELGTVPILKDYWLFDDERCFLMDYDFLGRFLGVTQVADEVVPEYVRLREHLLDRAQRVSEFTL